MMKRILSIVIFLVLLAMPTQVFANASQNSPGNPPTTTNQPASNQNLQSGTSTSRAPSFYDGAFSGSEGGITLESLTGSIIPRVVNWMASFIAAISVIFLVIGGLQYMSAGAEEEKVSAATRTVVYSIVGVLVAMFAYAIVFLFISLFSV